MTNKWVLSPRLGAFARSNAGAAAVELAIILPVLVLLAIGVAEFGRVYFTAITVANAATAGAQFGSLNSGISDAAIIHERSSRKRRRQLWAVQYGGQQ